MGALQYLVCCHDAVFWLVARFPSPDQIVINLPPFDLDVDYVKRTKNIGKFFGAVRFSRHKIGLISCAPRREQESSRYQHPDCFG